MRKLIVLSFITLDGVMQAPGGPEEDISGGFKHGGWAAPYFEDVLMGVMVEQTSKPFDLLLGKRTYDIFAAHWPYAPSDDPFAAKLNNATKYVVSNTADKLDWNNSILINDNVVEKIKKLKKQDGPDIQVHGSGNLIQTLLKADLTDELWLKIFPLNLGTGKRLFADGTIPKAFTLTESKVTPSGVIVASYALAGEIKIGSFEFETPTEAELVRRKKMRVESSAMSKKEIAKSFLRLASTGNIQEAYEQYVHPGLIHHSAYFKGDRTSLQVAMEKNFRQFPDKKYTTLRALEDGDLVAVHGRVSGVFGSDWSVLHIFRFKDGKIIEEWEASQEALKDSPNENGIF